VDILVTLYLGTPDTPSVDALHGHSINKLSVDKQLHETVRVRVRFRMRVKFRVRIRVHVTARVKVNRWNIQIKCYQHLLKLQYLRLCNTALK
jgi:hypothetical protein